MRVRVSRGSHGVRSLKPKTRVVGTRGIRLFETVLLSVQDR